MRTASNILRDSLNLLESSKMGQEELGSGKAFYRYPEFSAPREGNWKQDFRVGDHVATPLGTGVITDMYYTTDDYTVGGATTARTQPKIRAVVKHEDYSDHDGDTFELDVSGFKHVDSNVTEAEEQETLTGPAILASALVNNDTSGLDEEGKAALEGFLKYAEGYEVVDVERDEDGEALDPHFSWNCDQYGAPFKGGDVLNYVVRKL